MISGIYVGIRRRLRGETALLRDGPGGYIFAQFDSLRHRESHGWHPFPRRDFALHKGYVIDDPHNTSSFHDAVRPAAPAVLGTIASLRDVRDDHRSGGAGLRAQPSEPVDDRSDVRDDPRRDAARSLPSPPLNQDQSGWLP